MTNHSKYDPDKIAAGVADFDQRIDRLDHLADWLRTEADDAERESLRIQAMKKNLLALLADDVKVGGSE